MRQKIFTLLAGMALGMALLSGGYAAANTVLTATPSSQRFYIDGQQTTMTAYLIGGNNYVRLRDVGRAVGFNVYWDGAVQIERDKPYTGVAPGNTAPVPTQQSSGTVTIPTDGSRYVPRDGDKITCDDGTTYTITDASGYDANMFAEGPLGSLPTAACDWNSFPEIALPAAEARPLLLALAGERAVRQFQLLSSGEIFRGSLGCVQKRQIPLYRVQDRNSYLKLQKTLTKGAPAGAPFHFGRYS